MVIQWCDESHGFVRENVTNVQEIQEIDSSFMQFFEGDNTTH